MKISRILVLALFLGCASSDVPKEASPSKDGEVRILTLNVAGLPNFLTDESYPKERMYGIARMANDYDVIAYQEDFYYSKNLDKQSQLDSLERGVKWHKWSIWPWLRKSGLTVQTRWANEGVSFHAYSACYGHFEHSSDCWVPKGVLCTRTLTGDNITMDVCTTHMDAGYSEGDALARSIQVLEYMEALPTPVEDSPWLLVELGDFNMLPSEDLMKVLMKGKDIVVSDFNSPVDYVMITSNELLDVIPLQGGEALQFDGWSDHPAIEVILDLRIRKTP